MPRYSIDGAILEDIADAINAKTGETAAMAPGEMADAISSISGGGSVLVAPKTVEDGYVAYTFTVDVTGYAVGAIPSELRGIGINMSFNAQVPIAMITDTTATLTTGYFDGAEYLFETTRISADRFPSAIYAVPIE